MKILHVYKSFMGDSVGGVEQTINHIATNHAQSEIKHSVLALSQQKERQSRCPSSQPQRIYYKENVSLASTGISLSLLWDFRKVVQEADVLHYHFPWPFVDLLHLLNRIKKPSILTYHSDIVRQKKLLYFYKPIMHRFLHTMDSIVATSCNYLASSETLQRYTDKVSVIPIGLHKSAYVTPSENCVIKWRKRFPIPFFLFVGVLRYYKGLHILLAAAQHTSFPIVIIGAGPKEHELKQQMDTLQLKNVWFLGKVSEEDKVALIQLSYAMLFPSHLRSEAFGLSLLEGAMFGKPLISCEIGTGTSFINNQNETGFVIPPNDANALREAMQSLWANPELAKSMGQKAETRYQSLFTADKMVLAYEDLYRKTMQIHLKKEISNA